MKINIRQPLLKDADSFIEMMQKSKKLHYPWINAPLCIEEFLSYLERMNKPNAKGFLVFVDEIHIAGVFNISEIVRGCFKSAYLGFYGTATYTGQGIMSKALKLVLKEIFTTLDLHRVEANIQPANTKSIQLVAANGFKQEGYSPRYLKINHEWCDHERWALTYEDWSKSFENHHFK